MEASPSYLDPTDLRLRAAALQFWMFKQNTTEFTSCFQCCAVSVVK